MPALSLIVFLGCAVRQPVEPATPTATAERPVDAPRVVDVHVLYDGADRWVVTFSADEPLAGLWFPRDRHRFRAEGWEVQTEGWSWAEARYGELLLPEAPTTEVSVSFATDTRNRTKDYKLNLAMSDEGRLLYTGHLGVHPLVEVADGLERDSREVEQRWTVAAPGFEVLALDRRGDEELSWLRPDVDQRSGTYVYVGHIEPLVTDALTAVVDPGMPEWMQQQVLERLPAQLVRFEERTGLGLGHRPLVLASWDPEGRGTSLKGGSLTGLLQLHAGGEGWVAGDEDERVRWAWFLAHEGFHLWNGQRYGRASDSGRWEEWLSEGLSDRYALQALVDDALIDTAEMHRRIVDDANRCLVGVEADPLLMQTHPYGTWYACGQVSLFLLDHQLRQADSSLDDVVHDWWSRSEQVGGWTTTSLIDEVQRTLGDPTAVGWWTRLLYSGLDAPERVLAEALEDAGVPVSLVAPVDAPLQANVCGMGLERVAASCGCGLSLDRGADPVTAVLTGCDATLTAVGEHGLSEALCEAWLSARDQAATGTWEVGGQALSCTQEPGWSELLAPTD